MRLDDIQEIARRNDIMTNNMKGHEWSEFRCKRCGLTLVQGQNEYWDKTCEELLPLLIHEE